MKVTLNEAKVFVGYFLLNLAYYSSLPYLAIYLKVLFKLDPIMIAFIIAAGPISSCCASIFLGKQIDKRNKKNSILVSLLASFIIYGLFSVTKTTLGFFLANSLIGLFRGIIDTTFKAYLATEFTNKVDAFGYRAIAINLSAAVGPLLGYYFANHGDKALFIFCAAFQLCAGLILYKVLLITENTTSVSLEKNQTVESSAFIYLLITIILAVACYAQIDSSIPIILTDKISNGIKIYFFLLVTNAIIAIVFQPVICQFINKYGWVTSMQLGLGLFLISFLIPLFTLRTASLTAMIILFTWAELLLFQAGYLAIDQLSPSHAKGHYYGWANLDTIGTFIGPMIGCALYQFMGMKVMFLALCGMIILPAIFFLRFAAKDFLTEKEHHASRPAELRQ